MLFVHAVAGDLAGQVLLVLVVLEAREPQVLAELASEGPRQHARLLAARFVLGQAVDRYVPQELSDALGRPYALADQVLEVNAGKERVRFYLLAAPRAQPLLGAELQQSRQNRPRLVGELPGYRHRALL